ncbi:SLATT domain-containing protein [Marivita sp.]|uniref:SLATT domain-containing protein n=1 Tax=Marivita sp. TaxID=2003365 RepID=UPI003A895C2B
MNKGQQTKSQLSSDIRDTEIAGNQWATAFLASKIEPLKVNRDSHYAACESLQRTHTWLGVVVVALSTISLGFAFGGGEMLGEFESYFLGGTSVAVGILAGIQTFSNFSGRASEHQGAAVAYGTLLRELEFRVSGAISEGDNLNELPNLMDRWSEISEMAPLTKSSIRKKYGDP